MDELIFKALLALLLLGLGGAYALGWRRLRAGGHPRLCATWRLPLYLLGLAALGAAILSPLDRLGEELFSAHMIQHLLITMLAPPLLLLGNPLPVVLWGLPRRIRRAAGRPLVRGHAVRRALATLTFLPVAWLLYVSTLWAWHLPLLYQAALRHFPIHVLEHVIFFATSALFWWPIIEPAPRLRRPVNAGFKILYLVAATAQNTVLGMFLTLPEQVIYPYYVPLAAAHGVDALDDQMFAGGIMWSNAHMYLLPILLILYGLARESSTRERQSASA